MTPPRDGNRDLQTDEVMRIRADLDKRTADEVKAAERRAKNAAAGDSALYSHGDETDRAGLFETIFGRKS